MDHLSTTSAQSLIRHAIYSQTGPPRRVDAWHSYGSISVKCLFHRYNDQLPSSGTEPKVDNLAVANLRSYLLSCTAAIVGMLALSVFPKNTTVICPVWTAN